MLIKEFAWKKTNELKASGMKVKYGEVLEAVSKTQGWKNWGTACAISPNMIKFTGSKKREGDIHLQILQHILEARKIKEIKNGLSMGAL